MDLSIPEVNDVSRLSVRPGQALLVRLAAPVTVEVAERIKLCLERQLVGVSVPIIVCGPEISFEVVESVGVK